MLEIKKSVVPFDEQEVMQLERIITDADEKEALRFLKKSVYDSILHSQQGKLKSQIDSANAVQGFIQDNK
jgi:hypothetical protein